MLLEIVWNGQTTSTDLGDGTVRVGGAPTDDLRLEGLPPGLVTLRIEGERVRVTASASMRIGAALFPARVSRLLLEGEEVNLPHDVVLRRVVDAQRRDARKHVDTAFVANELLGAGELPVEQTRAATLTCVTGNDQGQVYPLAFAECVLGRADDADVRVRDRTVSRRHAVLVRHGNRTLVQAVSRTNGVFVNGLRVKREREVRSGDLIELGLSVLRFDDAQSAPEERTFVEPPAEPAQLTVLDPLAGPPIEVEVSLEDEEASELTDPLPARRPRLPAELVLMSVGATMALLGAAVTTVLLR
jgi:hypothetical protein